MAYYLGINPAPTEAGEAPNPYFSLGQNSYSVGGGAPSSQGYMGSNPLLQNYAGKSTNARQQGSAATTMATSLDQVPSEVLQAQERYRPGTAGLGDQSSSLFDRSLLGQYNQWQGNYQKFGDQFQPWALQGMGTGGGGFNPSQVDLLNPIRGGENHYSYQYDPSNATINQGSYLYDPLTGKKQDNSFQTSTADYRGQINGLDLPTIQNAGNGYNWDIFQPQEVETSRFKSALSSMYDAYGNAGVENLPGYLQFGRDQLRDIFTNFSNNTGAPVDYNAIYSSYGV